MSEERRRFTRLNLNQKAILQLGHVKKDVSSLINLAVGGCLLEIPGPLMPGKRCTLIIPLHHMAPDLQIIGEIIRSDGKHTSIQFTEISPENLTHLHNLIRFNAENPDQIDKEIQNRPGLI